MARPTGTKQIAENRRARHDYNLLDRLEAGIVLTGTEVKSLREGRVELGGSFADVRGAEVWLVGVSIAEYGHGKRKAVLSDYTFAVRDEATGELKTIGKAYSGLTDAEIAQLTAHFLSKVLWQRGRFHAVEPDTVLEIAFDRIQPSDRHSSGLAMRFPRIARIRTDKSPADIDTLSRAQELAKAMR